MNNNILSQLGLILAGGFLLGISSPSQAATDLKFGDMVKEVNIKGDFRLRQENFYRTNKTSDKTANSSSDRYRQRQRFRLRLETNFKLQNNFETTFRFASGSGEQVSTNQSFDNLSNQKSFWIDRAYLQWKPIDEVNLVVGKMPNPFWAPYSDDIVWDGDFNPEGASESFQFFGPLQTKIFVNALQMVADEDGSGTKDQGMLGQQLGIESLIFDQSKLTVAVALHEWINENKGDFSQANPATATAGNVQDGNRRQTAANTLSNEFRVVDYTAEYKTALFSIPLSLQGTYINNLKATLSPHEDKGFQYGFIFGKAGKAKSAEAAYFYKRSETDSTVADIADSDFGAGGTNRRGHIFWVAYSPTDFLTISAKEFITQTLNVTLSPNDKPINRTQIDFLVKF